MFRVRVVCFSPIVRGTRPLAPVVLALFWYCKFAENAYPSLIPSNLSKDNAVVKTEEALIPCYAQVRRSTINAILKLIC